MDEWEINIENTVKVIYLDAAPSIAFWYSVIGDEGNSISIGGLENKYIVSVQLNRFELEPTNSFPANDQYSYNVTTGVFSFNQPLQSGDKLKIIYRAIV